ncbi:MAG TPA: hypothetical protein VGG33_03075 [Polyangia bacterium]
MRVFRRAPLFKVWRGSQRLGAVSSSARRAALGLFLTTATTALASQAGAAPRTAAPCAETGDARIWWSPEAPVAGQPVRILAVAPDARSPRVHAGRASKLAPLPTTKRLGPPPSFAATIESPAAGEQRIELRQGDRVLACKVIDVVASTRERPRRALEPVFWKSTRAWDKHTEGLYAAFVEALFDAPVSESLSFRPLAPALRDPKRNFLYDHLGLGEDDPKRPTALPAEPDCADLPYFLRGYFAWKLGLPMGFRDCNRGSSNSAPTCGALVTNEDPILSPAPVEKGKKPRKPPKDALGAARVFLRKLANTVHSGSARTSLADPTTDLYPVPITPDALRPGTVFADPYGHVLVLAKWVPPQDGKGGLLLAVDGQPDGSIARKRFWEGTFLFASGEKSAGPGWKAFRPLVAATDAPPSPLPDTELKGDFVPASRDQEKLSTEAFYVRMSKLINPRGLPPETAYEETLAALVEQLETRIGSVDNGEKNARETNNALIPMPEGPKIFETVGPWEDYATPSRDMRLIIAMNVLLGLPEKVEKHPELFVLAGTKPAEARAKMQALHDRLIPTKSITYTRSDGSQQTLTIADLLARRAGFEVAYNPNDCVEVRWGAPAGSPEMATCKRRAPPDQLALMEKYRAWFREARRPPR